MMISAEAQLCAVLLADSSVTSLVGDRLYADELPQGLNISAESGKNNVISALVYERTGSEPTLGLDDTVFAVRVALAISAWGATRGIANELARTVSEALRSEAIIETERQSNFDPTTREAAVVMFFDVWET